MKRPPKLKVIVCWVGGNPKRDEVTIGVPKSLSKKDFDHLVHRLSATAFETLTARRRRRAR